MPKRKLSESKIKIENVEYEEQPWIEVRIEAGENSDPAKLEFTSKVYFTSSSSIEIDLKFDNPTQVSINQPEDILVVTFWGPFIDKEDGLGI